jgi:hypothetical protein
MPGHLLYVLCEEFAESNLCTIGNKAEKLLSPEGKIPKSKAVPALSS